MDFGTNLFNKCTDEREGQSWSDTKIVKKSMGPIEDRGEIKQYSVTCIYRIRDGGVPVYRRIVWRMG